MGYIGNEPTTGHFPVDNFTSSGGSTYTLAKAPASAGAIEVSVQGVLQPTTAYTVSGTTLNMAGVTTGVKIFVRHLGETLVLPTPADGSVTTAKLGTNSVDGTKIAMGSDAQGDILYHGASDYARLAKGTASQQLRMNSGATAPEWATITPPASGWTQLDKQATTSGTEIRFPASGSFPADTKVITILLDRVSQSGTGESLRIQMGNASGYVATGYEGGTGGHLIAAGASINFSTYFTCVDSSTAVGRYSGSQTYYLQSTTSHIWSMSGDVGSHDGGGGLDSSGGMCNVGTLLTHLKFYTNNTFDNGSISCLYMS
jgi:hypothetical protein